jgi:hypothetical protein
MLVLVLVQQHSHVKGYSCTEAIKMKNMDEPKCAIHLDLLTAEILLILVIRRSISPTGKQSYTGTMSDDRSNGGMSKYLLPRYLLYSSG